MGCGGSGSVPPSDLPAGNVDVVNVGIGGGADVWVDGFVNARDVKFGDRIRLSLLAGNRTVRMTRTGTTLPIASTSVNVRNRTQYDALLMPDRIADGAVSPLPNAEQGLIGVAHARKGDTPYDFYFTRGSEELSDAFLVITSVAYGAGLRRQVTNPGTVRVIVVRTSTLQRVATSELATVSTDSQLQAVAVERSGEARVNLTVSPLAFR
jgi:hypothetical protein